jgi:hypothetical protein
VKRKYNTKAYKYLKIALKPEEFDQINEYSKESGESKNGFFRRMIVEHAVVKKD